MGSRCFLIVMDSNEVRRKNKRSQLGRGGGVCRAEMREPAFAILGLKS